MQALRWNFGGNSNPRRQWICWLYCATDKESNHIPGEERVFLLVLYFSQDCHCSLQIGISAAAHARVKSPSLAETSPPPRGFI
jgi:hypothetical protein